MMVSEVSEMLKVDGLNNHIAYDVKRNIGYEVG